MDAFLEAHPARVIDEQRHWLQRFPYGPQHADLQAGYVASMARAAFSTATLPTPEQVFVSLQPEREPPKPLTVEEQIERAKARVIAWGGTIR